jgi:hypothetical protein
VEAALDGRDRAAEPGRAALLGRDVGRADVGREPGRAEVGRAELRSEDADEGREEEVAEEGLEDADRGRADDGRDGTVVSASDGGGGGGCWPRGLRSAAFTSTLLPVSEPERSINSSSSLKSSSS